MEEGESLTVSSHLLISESVHLEGSRNVSLAVLARGKGFGGRRRHARETIPPVGSFSAGKISPPHILHAAAAVTIPAKPL